MFSLLKRFWAVLVLALGVGVVATAAYAMAVEPVVLDLLSSGRQMSSIVTVENTFKEPLPVEVSAQVADLDETGALRATGKATEDLLIFPPQAIIQPGRTQSFRVQYVGDPDLQSSRHYFATVAQQPVPLAPGTSGVQVLYNFQVVVNVGVAGVRPNVRVTGTEIIEQDGAPHAVLLLQNDARTYGYLASGSLRLIQRDASGREIFRKSFTSEDVQREVGYGMVGANQRRRLVTPIVLPQMGGTLEAEFTPRRR